MKIRIPIPFTNPRIELKGHKRESPPPADTWQVSFGPLKLKRRPAPQSGTATRHRVQPPVIALPTPMASLDTDAGIGSMLDEATDSIARQEKERLDALQAAYASLAPKTPVTEPTWLGKVEVRMPTTSRAEASASANPPAGALPGADYRTTADDRASFKTAFLAHAGPYPDNNARRFNQYLADVEKIRNGHPHLQGVPIEDLVAVRGYTSGDARWINRPLKQLADSDTPAADVQEAREIAEKFQPYVKALVSGLNQLPPFTGTVYRGYQVDPSTVATRFKVGSRVSLGSPLASSSKRLERAFVGNVRFVIESTQGRDISLLSLKPKEEEVLFSGGEFEVVHVLANPDKGVDRHERAFEVRLRQVSGDA